MKQILAFILAALTLFSFVACKSPSDLDTGDLPSNENGKPSAPSDAADVLKADEIAAVTSPYSEGVAFVCKKGDSQNSYCIDKTGKIIFSIADPSVSSSFTNGFVVTDLGICDKNGKIVATPQSLGGDEIVRYDFSADYILVSRSTTSYKGTVTELATFNTKFEKIVDFSSEFYDTYTGYGGFAATVSIDRYILTYSGHDDTYLDLYTGEILNDRESLRSKIRAERESDLWEFDYDDDFFYNRLDDYLKVRTSLVDEYRTPILDLSQDEKYKNIYKIGNFENGIAPVIFCVSFTSYYYTVIDEEGNFKFDPVRIGSLVHSNFEFDNGYFVCEISTSMNEGKRKIVVYDITGNLVGEKNYTVDRAPALINTTTASIDFSDGVICLVLNNDTYICDAELTPLF